MLLFLRNWFFNFLSLWLIFCLFNLSFINALLFCFSLCSFQLCLFCVFLKLVPTLSECFSFRRKLLLMFILVLLEKLVDLQILRNERVCLRVLQRTLVGSPFCLQAQPRKRSQFCVARKKIRSQEDHEFRHQPAGI